MNAIFFLYFGANLLLWLSLFAFIKIRYPDSPPGKVLATIA